MSTVRQIYEKYRVPPWLQLHQLRVAAVGKLVAGSSKTPVDVQLITTVGLFHDMGNIIKFDFSKADRLMQHFDSEGVAYWEHVQREFIALYGSDEKEATRIIAQEIGLSENAIAIMEKIGWGNMSEIIATDSFETKITEYGDMRVGPFGLVSVAERAHDGFERYRERMREKGRNPEQYFDTLAQNALVLEQQIFAHSMITSTDITDETITPSIEELWEYNIT